jgi:hypothetical protein
MDQLFANTDVALYRAKGMGKTNLQVYSPSINIESYRILALESDLRSAILDDEFIIHYRYRCDLVQGYLFSKPVKAEIFSSLISKERFLILGSNQRVEDLHRRKYFRMDLPAPITSRMTISEFKGQTILIGNTQVVIENIGVGGLRVSTSVPLPVSKKMKLKIETEIFQQPFCVVGNILWKEEIAESHFQYGFEFDLTEQERNWLNFELPQLA